MITPWVIKIVTPEVFMARRRGNKATYGALGPWLSPLQGAATLLAEKVLSHYELALTHQEYLDLLVPSPLHEAWMQVSQYASNNDETRNAVVFEGSLPFIALKGELVLQVIRRRDGEMLPPLLPKKITLQTDTPTYGKLHAWVQERCQIGYQWGLVKHVLAQLDRHCKTPGQVRYYWPVIQTLADATHDPSIIDMVAVPDKGAPPLPQELRPLLQETAATVTGATLVDKAPPLEAPITVDIWDYHDFGVLCRTGQYVKVS
jgi:hypothetical protein